MIRYTKQSHKVITFSQKGTASGFLSHIYSNSKAYTANSETLSLKTYCTYM